MLVRLDWALLLEFYLCHVQQKNYYTWFYSSHLALCYFFYFVISSLFFPIYFSGVIKLLLISLFPWIIWKWQWIIIIKFPYEPHLQVSRTICSGLWLCVHAHLQWAISMCLSQWAMTTCPHPFTVGYVHVPMSIHSGLPSCVHDHSQWAVTMGPQLFTVGSDNVSTSTYNGLWPCFNNHSQWAMTMWPWTFAVGYEHVSTSIWTMCL